MNNLLIATDCYIPRWDGIARFLKSITPSLSKTFSITILAPAFVGADFVDANRNDSIKIIRIPLRKIMVSDLPLGAPKKSLLAPLVRTSDIVWSQTIGPIGMMAHSLAHRYRKPLVSYVHSVEWDLVAKSMSPLNILARPARYGVRIWARRMYNRCSHLMVPSQEVQDILHLQNINTPTTIIPLGVDTNLFCPPINKRTAKQNMGLPKDAQVIGYVGRIAREKDIITLYRAFISIQKRYPQLYLLIVGGGVLRYINHMKDRKNVIVLGPQDNVVPMLQAMDIYVLASLLETTSLSTIEAMACGVVPVCTPAGLIKDYIQPKQNGLLFPFQNPLVLSLKLRWLLDDPARITAIGTAARRTAVERFNWNKTAQQCAELINNLIHEG